MDLTTALIRILLALLTARDPTLKVEPKVALMAKYGKGPGAKSFRGSFKVEFVRVGVP